MAEYISREEAIKELREVYENEYPTASGDFDEYASHDVPNVLRNMKVADGQSMKHGRWTYPYKDKDINQCSECRSYVQDKISNVREMFAYCPFCGARMDLKDGDTND